MTKPTNPTGEIVTTEPGDFWSESDRLFEELRNNLYSGFWTPWSRGTDGRQLELPLAAPVDVADRGESYEISAELPGIPKEGIDVRVVGRSVVISAEQKSQRDEKGRNWVRRERAWSGFHRQVDLPEPVRADGVTARSENGVLTVSVPKAHPVVESKVKVE